MAHFYAAELYLLQEALEMLPGTFQSTQPSTTPNMIWSIYQTALPIYPASEYI